MESFYVLLLCCQFAFEVKNLVKMAEKNTMFIHVLKIKYVLFYGVLIDSILDRIGL